MTTLIVNKATAKDISLLIDIAKKLGIDLQKANTSLNKSVATKQKMNKQKEIIEISKKVNQIGTKKAFAKLGLNYDSYSR